MKTEMPFATMSQYLTTDVSSVSEQYNILSLLSTCIKHLVLGMLILVFKKVIFVKSAVSNFDISKW